MKKRSAIYENAEYRSADPEITRFADEYLAVRGMTARTIEAYQRDLEHFGSFLKARAGDDKTGATVALTVLFGPLGLIKHGKNIEIKEGTPLTAFVADDITMPPAQ